MDKAELEKRIKGFVLRVICFVAELRDESDQHAGYEGCNADGCMVYSDRSPLPIWSDGKKP